MGLNNIQALLREDVALLLEQDVNDRRLYGDAVNQLDLIAAGKVKASALREDVLRASLSLHMPLRAPDLAALVRALDGIQDADGDGVAIRLIVDPS